jgi:pSer/pThr/pTyr-binding forkhead associated (FHA) protein
MPVPRVTPPIALPVPTAPPVPGRPRPPTLWITYGGARFPVEKDRFVIGRVKNSSDLVIKDPNVSRHHAAIERRGSEFVLQDLGSTNGIVFMGQRISQRVIEHGDVVYVGDHEIRFGFD